MGQEIPTAYLYLAAAIVGYIVASLVKSNKNDDDYDDENFIF